MSFEGDGDAAPAPDENTYIDFISGNTTISIGRDHIQRSDSDRSAALLVGVGLALQTFFQDIISGIFILIDQSVHVGDIIEIDGKVGRVVEIKLRTTRVVTRNNRVMVIPNHKFMLDTLFNWTQNSFTNREQVNVGVAYGSDVQLVKKILLQCAEDAEDVVKEPKPVVLFEDFGDSSLNFSLSVFVSCAVTQTGSSPTIYLAPLIE